MTIGTGDMHRHLRVTMAEQIACVKREIKMRERVYPRWVEANRMTEEKAAAELAAMNAVLHTLEQNDALDRPELWGPR